MPKVDRKEAEIDRKLDVFAAAYFHWRKNKDAGIESNRLDREMVEARAAVLARMAHPDRAVLDAADIANRAVLAWISELMDAKPDTPEMVMLKRLSDICHAYESARYPIGEPK